KAALASMRESVDQLAAQVAAGQQQVADNIAKLHADEQKILQKLSATPQKLSATTPGATAAPVRKPAPVTAPPSPSASPSPSAPARGAKRRADPFNVPDSVRGREACAAQQCWVPWPGCAAIRTPGLG